MFQKKKEKETCFLLFRSAQKTLNAEKRLNI